jgi:hypothetical protein
VGGCVGDSACGDYGLETASQQVRVHTEVVQPHAKYQLTC